jgi:hypothetical protein
MLNLGVATGALDVVICVLGLYFAADLPATAAELWRTVRPGGTLAVTTWGARALEPAHSMYLEVVAAERPDLDLRRATLSWERINLPSALTQVFTAAGIPPPVVITESVTRPITADDYWTVVIGSGYRVMLGSMRPEAITRVYRRLCRRMEDARVGEITADVMYARVRKG